MARDGFVPETVARYGGRVSPFAIHRAGLPRSLSFAYTEYFIYTAAATATVWSYLLDGRGKPCMPTSTSNMWKDLHSNKTGAEKCSTILIWKHNIVLCVKLPCINLCST